MKKFLKQHKQVRESLKTTGLQLGLYEIIEVKWNNVSQRAGAIQEVLCLTAMPRLVKSHLIKVSLLAVRVGLP